MSRKIKSGCSFLENHSRRQIKMIQKEQALKYQKNKVIVLAKCAEKSERFYLIVTNCYDDFLERGIPKLPRGWPYYT
jgi:hypothetical protein